MTTDPLLLVTGFAALGFAAIHVLIGRLRFLDVIPRSRWLSFAGGVAVAYVFLHLLPELAEQASAGREDEAAEGDWIYPVALAGLVAFYALERTMKRALDASGRPGAEQPTGDGVFWIHIGSFAAYNVLIGYLLLHREDTGAWSLLVYAVAMALHFVTNDFGLRQDHKDRYDRTARWLLAAGVVLGWILALLLEVPEAALATLFAFLAGGVILNVLKEELPEERQSRLWPFVLGTVGFGALSAAA